MTNPTSNRPLDGVRVLDLSHVLAGPYCSLLLADMGADVIKIERPPSGDPARQIPPLVGGESAYFLSVNRNKRSLVLDLRQPAGQQVFFDLVQHADVVLENFRPGVATRLGFDYPKIAEHNSRIIGCSISAFGQDGPYRTRPAFDLVVQALSGVMSMTGEPGRPPVRMGLPIGDLSSGVFAALGILAALFERERTGRGRLVDVAMLDSMIGLLTYLASNYFATGSEPAPVGSAHHNIVPYQAFETADGYIVVAVLIETFWENLCKAMELEYLINDPRFGSNTDRVKNKKALIPLLEATFRKRTGAEWLKVLDEADVPCAPVNSIGEALADPQVAHRKMVTTVEHPTAGEVRMTRTPLIFQHAEGNDARPAPLLGQHTNEILRDVVKYSPEQIENLLAQGTVQ